MKLLSEITGRRDRSFTSTGSSVLEPPLPAIAWPVARAGSGKGSGIPTTTSPDTTGLCVIATWNDNPRPFTWTKTADEILNSLADYLTKLGTSRSITGKANQ